MTEQLQESIGIVPIDKFSEEPIFYVYFHKRPDGSVFYVGKGKGRRAWSKKDRNKHWKHVVQKHKLFDVEIVKEGLTEFEAFDLESRCISEIGMENLTNQTLGGVSTTGFKHSDETRKLQSLIALERIKQRPELADSNMKRLSKLHDLARNDAGYKKRMSDSQKESWKNKPDDKKKDHIAKKVAWLSVPENRVELSRKLKQNYTDNPDLKAHLSRISKDYWRSLSEDELERRKKLHGSILRSPEVIKARNDVMANKIVVNRKYLFNTTKEFLDISGSKHNTLQKAFRSANRMGFKFAVSKGYFVETVEDCPEMSSVVEYNGQDIKKLDFDCLPRSKAVVGNSKVFLSMMEAATGVGKPSEASADFITKNMRLSKPAFGIVWREASSDEVYQEVIHRLKSIQLAEVQHKEKNGI